MEVFNINEFGSAYCNFGFGPSFGHGSWFMGGVMPILFWILIAYIVVSVLKSLFSLGRVSKDDSALETLRNKFAAGEINEQEYLERKNVLKN